MSDFLGVVRRAAADILSGAYAWNALALTFATIFGAAIALTLGSHVVLTLGRRRADRAYVRMVKGSRAYRQAQAEVAEAIHSRRK